MKLRYVKWVDSHGPGNGWLALSDIWAEQLVVRSVGFVLHDTPELLVLVPHLCLPAEDAFVARQGRGALTIPKASILETGDITVIGCIPFL